MAEYAQPGWFTKHAFNPFVAGLARMGISMAGSAVLEVQGRKSGRWRPTPVNPLPLEGERYLVAPRGETQWVRNIRVSGAGRLVKGRKVEEFRITEVADAEKPPVLRAYLEKWKWEVGQFFPEGISAESSDEELGAIADGFPAFRIEAA